MTDPVTRQAHAKANLFLRVLARDAEGYHGIETLFCRLELADTLTGSRTAGPGVTLEVEGADTGPADENLVVRAARLVLEASKERFGVHFSLTKRIPAPPPPPPGAGGGGGGGGRPAPPRRGACDRERAGRKRDSTGRAPAPRQPPRRRRALLPE